MRYPVAGASVACGRLAWPAACHLQRTGRAPAPLSLAMCSTRLIHPMLDGVYTCDENLQGAPSKSLLTQPALHAYLAAAAARRTVEVYDPQRGSWQQLAAQLHSERKYCAAASLCGRLLVLGGMDEGRRRWVAQSGRVLWVDRWQGQQGAGTASKVLLPVGTLRLGCGAAAARMLCACALARKTHAAHPVYAAACRLSTVEAYDPREGRWSALTSMQVCVRVRTACGFMEHA